MKKKKKKKNKNKNKNKKNKKNKKLEKAMMSIICCKCSLELRVGTFTNQGIL